MKRSSQIAITGLLTLVFLVCLAPASLLGTALQQMSKQEWYLADAHGTLWNGRGVVTRGRGKDPSPVSLPPLEWRLDGFSDGDLLFQLQTNGSSMGQVELGWRGWKIHLRELGFEAKDVTPLLPSMLNKGNWLGYVNLRQFSAQGDLQSTRLSLIEAEWRNAATGLVPNGQLGTFVLKGHSENSAVLFSITSEDGPLVMTGHGSHSTRQGLQFEGELVDNARLTAQFPGFLGAYLQASGTPGHYILNIANLNI